MNTIPSIFNEIITPYTAVGGKERLASTGISAVILYRRGFIRRSFLNDIEKKGFDNIISIESNTPHYDIEELSTRFPFVRFILPEKEITHGEQINIAAREVQSPLFFVFRNDMKIIAGGTARRIAERLSITEEENEKTDNIKTGYKRLCTVPIIMNSNYEVLPSLSAPVTQKRKVQTVFIEPHNEGDLSLYPFDGIGIYDKQRFIQMGGYDVTLKKPYWQLMDFGFRAHLWGEQIALNNQIKLLYEGEQPIENSSIEDSYIRFYLKNLTPVFRNNQTSIPLYGFLQFLFNSGKDLLPAWSEFKEVRKWVKKNKYRFKTDARGVIEKWNTL
jgi:hypothetical protein